MPEAERVRGFLDAQAGDADIVLGTRLAVFVPLPRLGLLVVDEEQDASFKQQESLRYSARDVGILRARKQACRWCCARRRRRWKPGTTPEPAATRLLSLSRRAPAGADLPAVRLIDTGVHVPRDGLTEPLERAISGAARARRTDAGVPQSARLCAGARLPPVRLGERLPALLRRGWWCT